LVPPPLGVGEHADITNAAVATMLHNMMLKRRDDDLVVPRLE